MSFSGELEACLVPLLEKQRIEKSIPALSVVLVSDADELWHCHLGNRQVDDQIPPTSSTLYSVGSITKTMVAIVAMQLVDAGMLDIEATVESYLPRFTIRSSFRDPVRIKHLLRHASGLPREVPGQSYFAAGHLPDIDPLEALKEATLSRKPGTQAIYCNTGFILLGLILESITGQSLRDLLASRVFAKANMLDARLGRPGPKNVDIAQAVMNSGFDTLCPAPTVDPGPSAAGGVFASPRDISNYMQALLRNDGTLLNPSSLQQMFEPAEDDSPFGLSFFRRKIAGHSSYGHGGTYYGFACEMELIPSENLGVCVFTTRDLANKIAYRCAAHILQTALSIRKKHGPPSFTETEPVDPSTIQKLAGSYRCKGETIHILATQPPRIEVSHQTGELRKLGGDYALDSAKAWLPGIVHNSDSQEICFDGRRFIQTSPSPPTDSHSGPLYGSFGYDDIAQIRTFEREGELHIQLLGLFVALLEPSDEGTYRVASSSPIFAGEQVGFEFKRDDCSALLLNGEVIPKLT